MKKPTENTETTVVLECIVDGQTQPESAWINQNYEGYRCLFCSDHCRAKFEADPEQFIGETQTLEQPLGYS